MNPSVSTFTEQRSSVRPENIGAYGGNADRTTTHGPRAIDQHAHERIAEIGLLLKLVRECGVRIDDDAGEPMRIKDAFFEIELP